MIKKKLILLGIVLLVLPLISAFEIVSSDYSVDSYHTGLAGQETTNSRFTLTHQQASGDAEGSVYGANIGWFSQPSFCGDGVCDSDETCSSCVADCACSSGYSCVGGVCTADTVTPPPSGGGGGGSVCTYDWVCSEWYPEPCSGEGIQKRVCVNRGSCIGIVGMPTQNRTCIPETPSPAEPLFDIFAKIPLKNKFVLAGDVIEFDLELVNVGNITTLDVFFKYWIVDENNKLITESQDTRAIGEGDEFKIEFVLPDYLKPGIYKVYVQITYDVDKIAMANDSFEVMKSKFTLISRIALLSLLAFSVIVFLIALLFKLFRRIKKKEKKSKKFFKSIFKKKEKTKAGLMDYKRRVRRRIERHKNTL